MFRPSYHLQANRFSSLFYTEFVVFRVCSSYHRNYVTRLPTLLFELNKNSANLGR